MNTLADEVDVVIGVDTHKNTHPHRRRRRHHRRGAENDGASRWGQLKPSNSVSGDRFGNGLVQLIPINFVRHERTP